ncbi:dihydrodipicolinate synthase family protein [Pedococcus sp. P5_B7]
MYEALAGIYTALVTPFASDESLDHDAMRRLVDDQIEAGVAGLVVGGSTGEFATQTEDERKAAVETVVDAVSGRANVIVGIGSVRTRDSVAMAEHALAQGAVCGLLVMPYYEPLSETELFTFVGDIASVGLPLMIYNNPSATGVSLNPQFIAQLSRIHGVVALKDTTPEPARLFEIERLADPGLDILSGYDLTTIFSLLAGRRAVVWGAANAHPEGCVALWQLAVGDRNSAAALRLWKVLHPLQNFLATHDYQASNKAGANIRGLNIGVPRRPILPLGPSETDELRHVLRAIDAVLQALRAEGELTQRKPLGLAVT